MKKQLEKASPFTRDGRLKTSAQAALESASPFDTETGEFETNYKATVDNASKVDRVTGLPKGA